MTPKKLTTRPADRSWARDRRNVGRKYLEVAELVESEDGEAVNVCVGLAVLAGIAAGDAICAAALAESYSGDDHAAAASLLKRGMRLIHLDRPVRAGSPGELRRKATTARTRR